MKVVVTGSRDWSDREVVRARLAGLREEPVLLGHGKCRGLDLIAAEEAEKLGFTVKAFPYIGALGPAGGPVRNRLMLEAIDPDLVIAFHPDLSTSRGTASCVAIARELGYDVEVVTGKEVR